MLSEKICRTYRYSWELMRFHIKKDPEILSDCFPIVSVADLLRQCKSDQDAERNACHENIAAQMSERVLRDDNSAPFSKSHVAGPCATAALVSDMEYVKAFIDWAQKHPSRQNLPVADGLKEAAAWRCLGGKAR
jgi:hypothetical protein